MHKPTVRLAGVLSICLAFASITPSSAAEDLMEAYNKAVALMQEEKWGRATDVLQASIDNLDAVGIKAHGPAFGSIYYHLGFCRYQLRDYAKAKREFETSYKDFPNAPGGAAKNIYHAQSLFLWASCEQALGNFEAATKLYMKFIEESPPAEREAARASVRRANAAGEKAASDSRD